MFVYRCPYSPLILILTNRLDLLLPGSLVSDHLACSSPLYHGAQWEVGEEIMMRMPKLAWLLPGCCRLVCVSITPESWVVTRQTLDLDTPDLSDSHTNKTTMCRRMCKLKGLNMQRSCLIHKGVWYWLVNICFWYLSAFWIFHWSLCFTYEIILIILKWFIAIWLK